MQAGRAFTLVELLIVLALLVAITAIGMPALLTRLRPAVFEEGCAQVEAAAGLMAAAAREQGQSLALVARPPLGRGESAGPRLLVLALERADDVRTRIEEREPAASFVPEATPALTAEPSEQDAPEDEIVALPGGVRFLPRSMLATTPAGGGLDAEGDVTVGDMPAAGVELAGLLESDAAQQSTWLVAIGLPDGRILAGDDVVLVGGGQWASVSVSALGDRLTLSPQRTLPSDLDAEREEEEADGRGDPDADDLPPRPPTDNEPTSTDADDDETPSASPSRRTPRPTPAREGRP